MIHVIATIEVVPGKREAFLAEFHRIVPPVRAEAAASNTARPSTSPLASSRILRENTVTIMEKWESLPALPAHLTAPHMLEYRGRVKDLVVRVKLQVLQPAWSAP